MAKSETELYPGQAYFHRYNAAVRETENRFHDLKRLEELTEEALHPTSPTPGHAEGCPCHRCRTYREERDVEKAFEFLRIPLTRKPGIESWKPDEQKEHHREGQE